MIECVVPVGAKSFHPRSLADYSLLARSYDFLAYCLVAFAIVFALVTDADESSVESTSESTEGNDNPKETSEENEELDDEWETDSDALNRNEPTFTTLEDILAYEASEIDYRTTRRCLESRRIRDYDVLSDRFILVQMRDIETKYLIQLDRKCAGMTKGVTLRFDSRRGSSLRVCTNDSVRANMATDWGPPCRLPGFEPVNDVQLEQLKRGLVSERVE